MHLDDYHYYLHNKATKTYARLVAHPHNPTIASRY